MDRNSEKLMPRCMLCGGATSKRLVRCLDNYICYECTRASIDRLVSGGLELLVARPKCAFCGQEPTETVRIVGNEEVQICSNCLKLAIEIFIDEPSGDIKSLALSNERRLTS